MEYEKFRAWRLARYRTQKEAGEILGVTRVTVHTWETGKSKPPGRLLELACREIDRERQEQGLAT